MLSDKNYNNKQWNSWNIYDDIKLAVTISRSDYGDKPWTIRVEEDENHERFRDAEISYEFNDGDFYHTASGSWDEYYDIVIEPFIYGGDPQNIPSTILRNAVYLYRESDVDGYGPAYFNENQPVGKGIVSVTQIDQYSLEVMHWDADDRDESGEQDEETGEIVDYQLYAYWQPPDYQGPPNPEEVFGNKLNGGSWSEAEETGVNNGIREYLLISSKDDLPYIGSDENKQYLPLDKPGYQVWFGLRAFYGELEEYTDPGPPVTHNPNTVIFPDPDPFVVQDMLPPMFFDWREYDKTGEFTDEGDFISQSYGYENAIVVYFLPAVDPPEYDLVEPINYNLYWSTMSFLLPPDPLLLYDSKILRYSYNYDSEGPFPGLNEEAYQFLVTGLDPAQEYFFYIEAEDEPIGGLSNKTSTGTVHSQTPWSESSWCEPVCVNLPADTAKAGGDIDVHDGDVYLLYPTLNVSGFSIPPIIPEPPLPPIYFDDADYVFRQLIGGELIQGAYEEEILDNAGAVPFSYGTPEMAFQIDQNGDVIVDGQECALPIISYAGWESITSGVTLRTVARNASGQWLPNYLANDEDATEFTLAGSPTVTSYKYFDFDVQNTMEETWSGAYVIPYAFQKEGGSDLNDLRYFVQASSDDIFGFWTNYRVILEDEHNANVGNGLGSDIILKSAFPVQLWEPVPGQQIGPGNNLNLLYMLTGTLHRYIPWVPMAKIWRTGNPLDGWTYLGDIAHFLPGVSTTSALVPLSMEVVTWTGEIDNVVWENVVIYVAYNTENYENGDDIYPLRIAFTSDSADIGIPLVNWSSPGSRGIIEESFERRKDSSREADFDFVNLQVRNPEAKVTSHLFNELACSYFTGKSTLYLAETIGVGDAAIWAKLPADSPVDPEAISHGRILWQKLAYLENDAEEDIPYILFARRKSADEDVYDIMLWRKDGF